MAKINGYWAGAIGYAAGVIVCFGPATVESELAQRAHAETCAPKPVCESFGPHESDGLFKAMFWPMWLSYQAAKVPNATKLTGRGTGPND